MTARTAFLRSPVLVLGLVLVALLGLACRPGDESASLDPPDATYELEGVVQGVPGSSRAGGQLVVHHQAIPEFVSREGEPVGMDSMTMGFAVADAVDLAGIAEGDPVRFTFEVRWEGDPTVLVTQVEELPAGHQVDFARVVRDEVAPEPTATAVDEPPPREGDETVEAGGMVGRRAPPPEPHLDPHGEPDPPPDR